MGEIIQFPLCVIRPNGKIQNYAVRTPALSMDIAAIADLKQEELEPELLAAGIAQLAVWSSEPAVVAAVRNVHAVIGGLIHRPAGGIEPQVMAAIGVDPDSPEVLALMGAFRAGYWREMSGDKAAAEALSALVGAVSTSEPDALAALHEAVGWE